MEQFPKNGTARPELLTRFEEPSDGSLRYSPYGAMPGNPFASEALKKKQARIDGEFQKLFEHPDTNAPKSFQDMLLVDHEIGEVHRKMQNYDAFMEWKALNEPVSEEMAALSELVEDGSATIAEEFDFVLNTKMDKFEVGKVTHPYGSRIEYVDPFRRECEAAIEERGGIVIPKIFPYRSLTIMPSVEYNQDGSHELNGFIIKYKRDFGYVRLPDGQGTLRLVERQLAGVRVDDASGFPDVIKKMMAYTPISKEHLWEDNAKQYLEDTGCKSFIERAVQSDVLDDLIVPISTTIYGYKEKFDSDAHKNLGRVATVQPEDMGGMAYFGPTPS